MPDDGKPHKVKEIKMVDYEDLILSCQDDDFSDDCATCPYKADCRNQCEKVVSNARLEDVYPAMFT